MSKFAGWAYEIEEDSNFPDNFNVTFHKPNNEAWNKDDSKAIKKLGKKIELDAEPVVEGVYSFDKLIERSVRRGLEDAGMTQYSDPNPYIPDLSDPVEEEEAEEDCDDSDCTTCSGCTP